MEKVFTLTRKLLLTGVVALVTYCTQAQVSAYSFSQSTGTYTALAGGTVYGTSSTDDQRFVDPAAPTGGTTLTGVGIPIGFNFVFNSDTFDRIGINANGWIALGKSSLSPAVNMSSTSSYYSLASTSTITPAILRNRIAGVARDLQARSGATITVQTIGTAPNQVCVVEWANFRRYGVTGDTLNFQIRLNETTNIVDVVFGNMVFSSSSNHTGTSSSPQVGLGGSVSTDFNSRTTTTDWNNTTAATANNQGCDVNTGAGVLYPVSGTDMAWTPPPVCSGAPTAGVTSSSLNPVCSGVNFTLSLTGATSGVTGITYQWISSADDVTYSYISGATNVTRTDTTTQPRYYRCIVTCTASGQSDTSATLYVTLNSPLNCYCTSTATSTADEDIYNVTISTLNNSSTCSSTGTGSSVLNQYSDYTTTVAAPSLQRTLTYPFSVEVGTCGGNWNNSTAIFIDFNRNGSFSDPGEKVYLSASATSGPHFETGNITIPDTADLGLTRMRVITVETSTPSNISACGTYSWGETEDYMVSLDPAPPCTPPTGVSTLAGDTFATITFSSSGLGTNIEYGPSGFTPGTGTVVTNITSPYTITGLTPVSGYSYYLQDTCSGVLSPVGGPYNFNTSCSPYPTPGNGLANAIQVTGAFFTDTVNTSSCYGNNSPLRGGIDVFYLIPGDSCVTSITVSLCGSDFDTYLYVRDSSNSSTIVSNDDFCGLQSEVTFTPTPGSTYVVIAEPYSSSTGNVAMTVTRTYSTPVVSHSFVSPSCQGVLDGSAQVTITSGGYTPVSYLWSNGGTNDSINNIGSGTYYVTVTTACGTVVDTVVVTPAFNATAAVTDVSCNGGNDGAIDVTVTNGTAPYSYAWSNSATSEDLTGLTAGTYDLTATESGGCSVTLTATVNEPSAITISGVVTDANCNGDSTGSVNVTIAGGTSAVYSQSQTAIGGNLFQTSTLTFTGTPQASVAGTLVLSAYGDLDGTGGNLENWVFYDENGNQLGTVGATGNFADQCGGVLTTTIALSPAQIAAWTADGVITITATANSNVSLTLCGGDFVGAEISYTAAYTYAWSNGATTQDLNNIPAGTYDLTVTDIHNCSATASYTINEPTPLVPTLDSMFNVSCHGLSDGGVYVTIAGGTPPYAYSWSNGSTDEDLVNVPAGIYTGTVTDDHGCTLVSPAIPITEPDALVLTIDQVTDVTCNGNSDGGIGITVTGGTTPYTYTWSDASTSEDLSGVPAGIYTVNIADSNGCALSSPQITVAEPAALTLTLDSVVDNSCNGASHGGVYVTATGGNLPYLFSWSNGASTEDLTQVTAGEYTVSLTDAKGCTVSPITDTVAEAAALIASADSVMGVSCAGAGDGAVYVSATGGTGALSFAWSTSDTTSSISGLSGGNYDVTVTDENGCTVSLSKTVSEPDSLMPSLNALLNVACFGDNSGGVDITVNGGTPPYSFMWSNGDTTEDLTNVAAGNYTGTITDAHGCVFTSPVVPIAQPSAALSATSSATDQIQNGNVGSIDVTVSGGTSPYSYNWSTGSTTEDLSGLGAGVYSCTITDANGCSTVVRDTVNLIIGIGDVKDAYSLNMYPNPTKDQVTIDVNLPVANDVIVAIYSVEGKLVRSFNKENVLTAKFAVSFANEAEGVYFARITVGGNTTTHRIVVAK